MTDPTRPPSPGETPHDGTIDEISTQTVHDEPLGSAPGIADDLAPDGEPGRMDLPAATDPYGSEGDVVADDPATSSDFGIRGRSGGDEALAPIDPDAAGTLSDDPVAMTGEQAGNDRPSHGGH
jgi:hypothetical protein